MAGYSERKFIGVAPKGHHPDGSYTKSSDDEIKHEYLVQVFLYGDEGLDGVFCGTEVCKAPKGVFLVSDVVLNQFDDKGNWDIGASMMKSGEVFQDFIKKTERLLHDCIHNGLIAVKEV